MYASMLYCQCISCRVGRYQCNIQLHQCPQCSPIHNRHCNYKGAAPTDWSGTCTSCKLVHKELGAHFRSCITQRQNSLQTCNANCYCQERPLTPGQLEVANDSQLGVSSVARPYSTGQYQYLCLNELQMQYIYLDYSCILYIYTT